MNSKICMRSDEPGVKVIQVKINDVDMATLVNEKGEYPLDVHGEVLFVEPRTIHQNLGYSVGVPKEIPECLK